MQASYLNTGSFLAPRWEDYILPGEHHWNSQVYNKDHLGMYPLDRWVDQGTCKASSGFEIIFTFGS